MANIGVNTQETIARSELQANSQKPARKTRIAAQQGQAQEPQTAGGEPPAKKRKAAKPLRTPGVASEEQGKTWTTASMAAAAEHLRQQDPGIASALYKPSLDLCIVRWLLPRKDVRGAMFFSGV